MTEKEINELMEIKTCSYEKCTCTFKISKGIDQEYCSIHCAYEATDDPGERKRLAIMLSSFPSGSITADGKCRCRMCGELKTKKIRLSKGVRYYIGDSISRWNGNMCPDCAKREMRRYARLRGRRRRDARA